jgi:hypothetical protein
MTHLSARDHTAGNHILDHALTQRRDSGRCGHGEFQSLSEVTETSILKRGRPAPLRPFSQLVTAHQNHRLIDSCARLSGLSRSDFVL